MPKQASGAQARPDATFQPYVIAIQKGSQWHPEVNMPLIGHIAGQRIGPHIARGAGLFSAISRRAGRGGRHGGLSIAQREERSMVSPLSSAAVGGRRGAPRGGRGRRIRSEHSKRTYES